MLGRAAHRLALACNYAAGHQHGKLTKVHEFSIGNLIEHTLT